MSTSTPPSPDGADFVRVSSGNLKLIMETIPDQIQLDNFVDLQDCWKAKRFLDIFGVNTQKTAPCERTCRASAAWTGSRSPLQGEGAGSAATCTK